VRNILLALSLSGCVYIGGADHQDRLDAICLSNPDDPDCPSDPGDTDTDTDDTDLPVLIDCFADEDGDGFGAGAAIATEGSCEQGLVDNADDCDDTSDAVNPNAVETCENSIDDDCDGDAATTVTVFNDADGDGYGLGAAVQACGLSAGLAEEGGDCNDADSAINPGAMEVPTDGVDQDCDGFELCPADVDGDGVFSSASLVSGPVDCAAMVGDEDCADGDAAIYPGATEGVADGVDQDCDGLELCYADADDDEYGDAGASFVATTTGLDCAASAGMAAVPGDCDDADATINPGAVENCADAIDHDCSGDPGAGSWYADIDGDGFGDPATLLQVCDSPGSTYVTNGADCDDTAVDVFPGQTEVPADGVDSDCDGFETCYGDFDGDGFGDQEVSGSLACDQLYESNVTGDCDDGCANCLPGGVEICDSLDNDCDGTVDLNSTDATEWFLDVDADGYGGDTSVFECVAPSGNVAVGGDCDDTNSAINPGATEICGNNIDENCVPNDETAGASYWVDGDGDGFGAGPEEITCTPAANQVQNDLDCDDTKPGVFPGNTNLIVGDGVDQDCSGREECLPDVDNDGYAAAGAVIVDGPTATSCGPGQAVEYGDCAPLNPSINPGATETADNAVDEDCNNLRLCYLDSDNDTFGSDNDPLEEVASCSNGYAALGGDCNDSAGGINPGANDIVGNAVDEDCSGDFDCNRDGDGDGFSIPGVVVLPNACPFTSPGDCADGDPNAYPGATELCSGVVENCGAALSDLETDDDGDFYVECAGWVGVGPIVGGDDCDDTNAAVSPGGTEAPNNDLDEDCDGFKACWLDGDRDGFGVNTPQTIAGSCNDSGYSVNRDDCDDSSDTVYPGAPSLCDGLINDCDSTVLPLDESDTDGDLYAACTGWVGNGSAFLVGGGDCDDGNGLVNPGMPEYCDGIDSSCGTIPEAGLVTAAGVNYSGLQAAIDNIGNSATVIDVCGGAGVTHPVELSATDANINGISVGGDFPVLVRSNPSAPLFTFDGDLILQNLDLDGEALFGSSCVINQGGSLTMSGVYVYDCDSPDDGGGVQLWNGSTGSFSGGLFNTNRSNGAGGAIYCDNCDLLDIQFTTFDGNSAIWGGAVYTSSGTGVMDVLTFTNNTAVESGGAVFFDSAFGTLDNSSFNGNIASNRGGALMFIGGSYTDIGFGIFTSNGLTDSTGEGAAVALTEVSGITLTDSTVEQHRAPNGASAIHVDGASNVFVQDSFVFDNDLGARLEPGATAINMLDSRGTDWNGPPDNTVDVIDPAGDFQAGVADFTCNPVCN